MLKIENLKAGYEGMEILKGVDIEINIPEIVVIIGPNGSGKSTTLKSIFNLCNIYSGKIFWKGEDITKLETHKRIRKGISYVPQGRQVFPSMTLEENLEMGGFILESKKEIKKRIEEIYHFFPFLKEKRKILSSNLSGGEQQMLAIGRSLIQRPELLLLDEPSLGLSPKVMDDIFKKIEEINKEGVSVLIVEQNAKKAVELGDRTYLLENGSIALSGGKEILENPKIRDIYLG